MTMTSVRALPALAAAVVSTAIAALAVPAAPRVGATAEPAEAPVVHVTDQTYALRTGSTFDATITVSDLELDAVTHVRVNVHRALTAANDLSTTMVEVADRVTVPAAEVLDAGTDGLTGQLSVPVAAGTQSPGAIELGEPGVHPVTIELLAGTAVVATGSTYLELLDDATFGRPLSIAIAIAVEEPTTASGTESSILQLIEIAEAVDAPLSIALPPATASAITGSAAGDTSADVPSETNPPSEAAAAGDGTSESSGADQTVAERLAEALRGDELAALPAAPVDPSELVALDASAVFSRQLRAGEDTIAAASPFAAVSRSVWITDTALSAPAAAMLRELGVRMVLFDEHSVESLDVAAGASAFIVDLGDGDSLPAMTPSPLGSQLAVAVTNTSTTPNERAVRLAAEIELTRPDLAAPALVLGAPGLALPDAAVTARFAQVLEGLPDVALLPMSGLPGVVDGALTRTATPAPLPASAGADLSTRLDEIEVVRTRAGHASSMLVGSTTDDAWAGALDGLLAGSVDDETVTARLATIEGEVEAVLNAIVPPEARTFTMTGSSNTLRLTVHNDADEPLRIAVFVRSPKLNITEPVQIVDVPALSAVDVSVPVEARSNGTFTIEADVLTPDGFSLGPPVILKGRVNQLTGLSRVVTAGAILVLASWWYSHLRRRHRRDVPASA